MIPSSASKICATLVNRGRKINVEYPSAPLTILEYGGRIGRACVFRSGIGASAAKSAESSSTTFLTFSLPRARSSSVRTTTGSSSPSPAARATDIPPNASNAADAINRLSRNNISTTPMTAKLKDDPGNKKDGVSKIDPLKP